MPVAEILKFLTALSENNNREWFAENKAWYETVKKEFEKISTELILRISEFDEDIKTVQASECIFRIYRDARFSHDKTPYKTHFGVFIASAGGRKSQRGGYYLHLDPAASFIGAGVWCPEPPLLKALRQSVYDNIEELNEIRQADSFRANFSTFYEDGKLKKVPTGFPKDFEEAELLKLKHYLVEKKLPAEVLSAPDFMDQAIEICKAAYPLNRFLNYTVDEVM